MSKSKRWSKYIGVCKVRKGSTFQVTFGLNYATVYVKNVKTEYEAAKIYDDLIDFHGVDRRKNFPDPEPENLIPNTKLIRLTRGQWAIVDEEDYEYINQFDWYAYKCEECFYARRNHSIDGKRADMLMHRDIMGDKLIDHIDRNGLNNRRSNLRFCTQSQNLMNTSKRLKATSIYKGVTFSKNTGKWEAHIGFNHKKINLGLFIYEIDAARAYNQKAIELYGEFASPNEI